MQKLYYIFLGPPGSGKGTQAELLEEKNNLPILSTGKILRKIKEEDTDFGRKIKAILDSGQLVPDKIIEDLIANEISSDASKNGMIFDGYPRTIVQHESLIKRFSPEDNVYALFIDVSDKEVQHRLGDRRSCNCGATYHLRYNPPKNDEICDECASKLIIRDDDKPEVISARLNVYYENINPILKDLEKKGKLIKINGEQSIEDVHEEILNKI